MRETNSDPELLPLTKLEKPLGGRYKIVRQLRMGGFSQTFIAEDLHLPNHPLCVIKQLKPYLETEQDLQTARRLFDTEAKVLYLLGNHDQIPRLLAHFEENQNFYLAQELIEGEPLDQLLVEHQLWNEAEVVTLLRSVLEVLSFVHQQGVIHRDIKPSNLMYRPSDGKIVLIDFGAVKQVSLGSAYSKSGHTDLTVSVGTQGYTANEQLAGEPHFSSDIYAIGMVAIQALTGVRPKNLQKNSQTLELQWWYQEGISVCPELTTILSYMTRYDFRERYATANEALEALQALSVLSENSPESSTKFKSSKLSSKALHLLPPDQKPLGLQSALEETQRQFVHDNSPHMQPSSLQLSSTLVSEVLSPEFQTSSKLLLKRLLSVRGLVAFGFTILIAKVLLPYQTIVTPFNQQLIPDLSSAAAPTQGKEGSRSSETELSASESPSAVDPVAANPLNPNRFAPFNQELIPDLSSAAAPTQGKEGSRSSETELSASDAATSLNPNNFGEISNIPSGLFNYGGSTTWAIIRSEVDPIIQASHPKFQLRYTHPTKNTAGSGTGIQMLLEGQLAFSQSSRPLEEQEYQQALLQGFSLSQIPVALEGIAIAVHPSLSIPGLNLSQLQDIYTGKITNWQQVGGPNRKITPYSRPVADSGTVDFFVKNVLGGNALGLNVRSVDTTTIGLQKLTNDPGGIYYASVPEIVSQCGVKALPIAQESTNFVSPYKEPLVPSADCFRQKNQVNTEVFQTGAYPITRQLFVIIKQDGQIDQQAGEAYARLLMTNEGQELLAKQGFVRIR